MNTHSLTRTRRLAGAAALAAALALAADGARAQTLRGSPGSVERMYKQARSHDLTFYRSGRGVRAAAADGELVRLASNENLRLVGVSYPYALPTTRTFLQRLAAQYHEACGERLVVTSAARPRSLHLSNGAGEESVHPAGMAADIRKPSRRGCLGWLRETLLHVEGAGAIEATEEHHPPHFHVAVFPTQYLRYVGKTPSQRPEVSTRRSAQTRPASSSGRTSYRVREGDSLWTIARRHGVSVARLREANDLRGSRLAVGQTIVIPSK